MKVKCRQCGSKINARNRISALVLSRANTTGCGILVFCSPNCMNEHRQSVLTDEVIRQHDLTVETYEDTFIADVFKEVSINFWESVRT